MGLNQIFLTRECKRNCNFCFAKEVNKFKDYTSYEDYTKYLEILKKHTKYKRIHLLGGEPLLNPNFDKILKTTLENEFKITISTSGIENFGKIKHILNEKTEFSFTYPLNSEKKEKIMNNIKELSNQGIKITPSIVIENYQFNKELIEELKNLKVDTVIITPPLPNFEHSNTYKKEFDKEYSQNLLKIINEILNNNIKIRQDCSMPICVFNKQDALKLIKKGFNFGKCTIKIGNENGIFVGPNLDIFLCPIFSNPIGNLKKNSIETILKRKKELEKILCFGFNEKCKSCILFKNQICIPCASYTSYKNKTKINEYLKIIKNEQN
ncbi:radical SAM protein [Candidatus Woesearchaeota archaeon]|nr:radical SAM protein [Candidatus Woesearchaeota archaeon]